MPLAMPASFAAAYPKTKMRPMPSPCSVARLASRHSTTSAKVLARWKAEQNI